MKHQPRTLTAAEEMRLCAGFVVQPVVAGLVAFVSFPFLLLGRSGSGFTPDPTRATFSVALGTAMAAVAVTLVVAAPTAIWVVKRRAVTFTRALLFGLAIGNIPVVVGGALAGFSDSWAGLRAVMFASLVGVAGAAAFWAISIRGRDFSRDPD